MKLLIVIPARGESKGIPKKNVRLINGYPLIYHSIKKALRIKRIYDADVVVDTDDEEIAEVARMYGAEIIKRPKRLAGDDITLDPVIFHAVEEYEKNVKVRYDIIVTLQTTSPTLKPETLEKAIAKFIETKTDTMISVYNDPHLFWTKENDVIKPQYEKRINRQFLPEHYKETGGFLISKREYITENSRIGKVVHVYELPETEAIDIDKDTDWVLCEAVLKKKKIILRADGEEQLGMGHIYRCLSLAYHLTGHDILFVTNEKYQLGLKMIQNSFFQFQAISDNREIFQIIENFVPDIVINDILDTNLNYMSKMKRAVPRIVNFEDRGEGAGLADCVINALYESDIRKNVYSGFEYYFIRDEFLQVVPKSFSEKVSNIVILFGGSDPSDLTRKIYPILQDISHHYQDIEFHIITGFGYQYKEELHDDIDKKIYIHNNVMRVSSYMKNADLAITSQGRTIYELACMGVPSIVLAQNKREAEHVFASIVNGFINLGLGAEQDSDAIENTIKWLIDTPSVRREMHEQLTSKDFKHGQERVIKLILGDEEI